MGKDARLKLSFPLGLQGGEDIAENPIEEEIMHRRKEEDAPSLKKDKTVSRRDFLKRTGTGLMGLGFGSFAASCASTFSGNKQKLRGQAIPQARRGIRSSLSVPIIDIHRHCMPETSSMVGGLTRSITEMRMNLKETEGYSSATRKGITSIIYPEMRKINLQIQCQNEAGVTLSLLSFSMGLETLCQALFFAPDKVVTRQFNDAMAKMVAEYPDKLAFMVAVNPSEQSSIEECERCFKEHDAKGITIGTSWDGEFLNSQKIESFWQYAQDRDVAIFLHPPFVPIGYSKMNIYRLEEMIGRPFDTTMTVACMIYSGVFDRHPGLKIVLPHMGAALPNIVGRLDFGYRLGYRGLAEREAAVCRKKPSEYFRTNLYVDTMGFNPLGVKYAIETFGIDHVLFGTDYAAVPISPREHIDIVRNLGLSKTDEAKVLWENANRIFNLGL